MLKGLLAAEGSQIGRRRDGPEADLGTLTFARMPLVSLHFREVLPARPRPSAR
jgi:hypothetical protein